MTMTASPKWSALQGDSDWEVRSPRGTLTFTTTTPHAARQVAHAMASIDTLLTRIVNHEAQQLLATIERHR